MKKWYILMLLMSLWFIGAQAQETVRGVVTDAAGEPLIGANVVEKGQPSNGTITNLDGKFTLKVTSNKAIIAISMIGMKTVEVTVPKDGKTLTVRLHDDTQTLDEVVVVAYGQQKKVSVTGSISAVGNRELKQGPTSSVTNSLTGRIPGLVTRQTSGRPGEDAAALYIRGRATVNDASPLIMVDGIERDFSQIDPDEIESISVLKDASATAVYGVRGANGVILITTKKGKEGKPSINVRTEFGFTSPTKRPEMVNSAEWAELYNEAFQTQYYSPEDIRRYRENSDPDLFPNVNWFDTLFDDMAESERVNLNISGGGDIVRYYVAGSFYNENSIYKNAGNIYGYNSSLRYNKFNFRANIDLNVTPSTVLNLNLANIYEKSFGPGYGDDDKSIWSYTFMTSPNAFPSEYSDGVISGPFRVRTHGICWHIPVIVNNSGILHNL